DQAAIVTFDAFALSLVKKYHYLLGVNKSISIGDNTLLMIKRKEIINTVFDEYYNSKNEEFFNFVSTFALKKDDSLQGYIYNVCTKVDLLSNSDEFLDNYLNHFYSDEYINKRILEFEKLI